MTTHRTSADYYAGIPQYPGRITPAELNAAKAAAWDEGRRAVIKYAISHVENEPEHLEGYIDQHFVGVGGLKLDNPYRASNVEGMNQ